MDLFELELERRLQRRDPPGGFSGRVMEQVMTDAKEDLRSSSAWGGGFAPKRWGWGLTAALAASLAVGVFVQNRREEHKAAKQAEEQLVEALFVAGEKIQIARSKAHSPGAPGGN